MDILKMVSNDSNVSGKLKNIMKEKPRSKDKVKIIEEETEWCFNFRGMCLGVMAVSKKVHMVLCIVNMIVYQRKS